MIYKRGQQAILHHRQYNLSDLTLRPYQKQVITEVYQKIRANSRRILLFAPTGAGKTIISSRIVIDAISKGKKVMFVVHRDNLVQQTAQTFQSFGLPCGFIKSGYPEDHHAPVQIASVQSMASRTWWKTATIDVVLLDECHLTAFTTIIQEMLNDTHPDIIYIGLTATPWRLSKMEGMGDIFEHLVCAPMPYQLIEQGFLVKPSYYDLDLADLSGVKIDNTGEFNKRSLSLATDTPEFIESVINEWFEKAYNKRTIAFTVSVAQSKRLVEAFTAHGVKAAHVDGKTPTDERNDLYTALKEGSLTLLSNCETLIEGFDVPPVEVELMLRATMSKAFCHQMMGRVLRLSPDTGKVSAIILDFVGNLARHGFVEDIKGIELTKGGESSDSEPSPKKRCPPSDGGCGAMLYAFQVKCPECGYHFEVKRYTIKLKLKHCLRPEDIPKLEAYRQYLKDAYLNYFAPTWAASQFKEEYGYFPPFDWAKHAVFGDTFSEVHVKNYHQHLAKIAQRLSKDGAWIERYMSLEFGRDCSQLTSAVFA